MVFLNGDAIPELDAAGRPINDDHFLLLFNAHSDSIRFTLPPAEFGQNWLIRLDTASGQVDPADARPWRAKSTHRIEAHSMMVLSTTVVPEAERAAAKSRALRATASAAKAPMQAPRPS
jgi:glycogen operon protein